MNESLPLVSICCITYNQEKYIRQCLDGFIMQKTDFEFEVIIHDDASTDSTAEIIREYEEKYPNIIKPIYQIENQYTKGKGILIPFVYPRAKAKYIALCEGDDYWTDPYKLQKQVDFLENNEEYSLCFHNAIEHWEDGSREDSIFSDVEDREYSAVEIYKKWTIPTASVVFRKTVIDSLRYKEVSSNPKFIYGDIILFLTCAELGKLRGFTDVMSIYRRHSGGISFCRDFDSVYKFSNHNLEISKVFTNLGIAKNARCNAYLSAVGYLMKAIFANDNYNIKRFYNIFNGIKVSELIVVFSNIPRKTLSFFINYRKNI